MVNVQHVTGDGTKSLYQLCAEACGLTFPIQYTSTAQAHQQWPDPVSYLNVTGTGNLTDKTTSATVALPLTISQEVNSISLQNLVPANSVACVVTINVQ